MSRLFRRLKLVALVTAIAGFASMSNSSPLAAAKRVGAPAGSLVEMEMRSTVGLLLDEIPAGALRDDAADHARHRGDAFWIEKAQRQIRLTNYRLVFRSGFYT